MIPGTVEVVHAFWGGGGVILVDLLKQLDKCLFKRLALSSSVSAVVMPSDNDLEMVAFLGCINLTMDQNHLVFQVALTNLSKWAFFAESCC